MNAIKQLTPDLSVTGQIQIKDLPSIKAAGFAAIIVNRPDGEAPDQPDRADIEREAMKVSLHVHYLPVIPGKITDRDIDAFRAIIEGSDQPVLAFCRTGTRSTHLWSLGEAGASNPAAILKAAGEAGYDLSSL